MHLLRLFLALAATPLLAAPAEGTFSLRVFQGYHFPTAQVVKSGTNTADLSFTYQTRRIGFISYLGADKIKYFESAPAAVSPSEVATWEDYVAGPSAGYYVLRARSDGRLYLVQLTAFENQGKAASEWIMNFKWQALSGSGQTAPAPAAPSRQSGSSASGKPSPIGRDEMAELRGRVVAKIKVETALEMGMFGEVKNVQLNKPGTEESVRVDLLNSKGAASLSVDPGRYDVWITGRRTNRKLAGTIDLTGYEAGAIVPFTIRFDGFGAVPASGPSRTTAPSTSAKPADDTEERIRRAQDAAANKQKASGSQTAAPSTTTKASDDSEERIRRAQEAAANKQKASGSQTAAPSTATKASDDTEERIRRAQDAAAKKSKN